MTVYNEQQVDQFAAQAGFTGNALDIIVAISKAESGWNSQPPDNVNNDAWHSRDRGILQINSHWHPEVTDSCAYDPQCSFNAAYRISSNGTNFNPWATYTSGLYKQYLSGNTVVTVTQGGNMLPPQSQGNVLPFKTLDTVLQNTLIDVPGFEGLCEAIDIAEQFQPLTLSTPLNNTSTQNTDYTLFGIDTGVPNPNKVLNQAIQLPADNIQAILVFVAVNTRATLVRGILILLGVVILVALFQNIYQENVSSKINFSEIMSMVA